MNLNLKKLKNNIVIIFSIIFAIIILVIIYNIFSKENYVTDSKNYYGINKNCNYNKDNLKSCSETKLSTNNNDCIGWNNLVYKNNKFNRVNCNKNKNNSKALSKLGPGNSKCYTSNTQTEPLYKKFDKSKVDFEKYKNLGITNKYLGLDKNINVPSVNGNENDSRKGLFQFNYNKCSPDCCPSTYSCSGGCICLSNKQKNMSK